MAHVSTYSRHKNGLFVITFHEIVWQQKIIEILYSTMTKMTGMIRKRTKQFVRMSTSSKIGASL